MAIFRSVGTRITLLTSLSVLALQACGGGGSSSGDPSAGDPSAGGAPAATNSLSLTGTAATGAAIAGKKILAKCRVGTGEATSAIDGTYVIQVADGELPCALKVVDGDGSEYHSVAEGAGKSANANLTPMSELIVARLAGAKPADFFAAFDLRRNIVSGPALAAAREALKEALRDLFDLGALDPLKDRLEAAHSGRTGDAHDQKLDAMKARLALAKTSIAEVAQIMAANAAAPAIGGGTAPVAFVFQSSAAGCPAFKSMRYQIIKPNESASTPVSTVTIDASTLSLSSGAQTLLGSANAPCDFSFDGGKTRVMVASSGLAIVRSHQDTAAPRIEVAIPDQRLSLSDVVGEWNMMSFRVRNGGTLPTAANAKVTVSETGVVSQAECGNGIGACGASVPVGGLMVNPLGGFIMTPLGATSGNRVFAMRNATGDTMFVGIDASGIMVGARPKPIVVPAVGDTLRRWDISVTAGAVASTVTNYEYLYTASNAQTGVYTRKRSSDGLSQNITANVPRAGMTHMPLQTGLNAANVLMTTPEFVGMTLAGFGLGVYTRVTSVAADGLFGVSVVRPDASAPLSVSR